MAVTDYLKERNSIKMIKFIKENILGILAVTLLVNGMSIIYMIRYTNAMLIRLALIVGMLDTICALVFLLILVGNFTKKLFGDDENDTEN